MFIIVRVCNSISPVKVFFAFSNKKKRKALPPDSLYTFLKVLQFLVLLQFKNHKITKPQNHKIADNININTDYINEKTTKNFKILKVDQSINKEHILCAISIESLVIACLKPNWDIQDDFSVIVDKKATLC